MSVEVMRQLVTPQSVLQHSSPTTEFKCRLRDNTFAIDFLEFEVKDGVTKRSIFQVIKEAGTPLLSSLGDNCYGDEWEDQLRTVRYAFPADFLRCKRISTSLKFQVGDNEARDFRMVERHYFKGKLLRSYDFEFGFCIPNSVNTWEAIYTMPHNTEAQIRDFVGNPGAHTSDSFYFVGDRLIMHNKAVYTYKDA